MRLLPARAILYNDGMNHSAEILCTGCGKRALVRAEPVYDGFKKVGETFVCTVCGKRYPSEAETPFVSAAKRPALFTEADKPKAPSIFRDDERKHSCCWCKNFVVNPFEQRCGLTNRAVEATDLCLRFVARKEPNKPETP